MRGAGLGTAFGQKETSKAAAEFAHVCPNLGIDFSTKQGFHVVCLTSFRYSPIRTCFCSASP